MESRTQRAGRSRRCFVREQTAAAALASTASSSCLDPYPCTTVPMVKGQCSQEHPETEMTLMEQKLGYQWFVSLYTSASLPCFWPDLPMLPRHSSLRAQQGPGEGILTLSASHGPSSPLRQGWVARWHLQWSQILYGPWRSLMGWLTQAAHSVLLSRSQSSCAKSWQDMPA